MSEVSQSMPARLLELDREVVVRLVGDKFCKFVVEIRRVVDVVVGGFAPTA